MNTFGTYYKPSGKSPTLGLIIYMVFTLVLPLFLGYIYGMLQYFGFQMIIKMILPIIFGMSIAFLVGMGARFAKLRAPFIMVFLGAIATLLAYYAHWIGWLTAIAERQVSLNPIKVFDTLRVLAGNIIYGSDRTPLSAEVHWFAWLVEAVLILGIALYVTSKFYSLNIYCEPCDRWTDRKDTVQPLRTIDDAKGFKEAMNNGNFSIMDSLGDVKTGLQSSGSSFLPDSDKEYGQVDVRFCSKCNDYKLLMVSQKSPAKILGRWFSNRKVILENMFITNDQYKTVRKMDIVEGQVDLMVKEDSWLEKIKELLGMN